MITRPITQPIAKPISRPVTAVFGGLPKFAVFSGGALVISNGKIVVSGA